jgi:hypothetical protein
MLGPNNSPCGLCGEHVSCHSIGEQIDWIEYDRYGRNQITGSAVRLNILPPNIQSAIKKKRANIAEDSPICPRCYSKTLDEVWVTERAICKDCNSTLENIGWSLEQPQGHSIMSVRLMGCPKCRLVYFIPSRSLTESPTT